MVRITEQRSIGPPGNLPAEISSFVGRRRELAEIELLLSRSRLVTVTGVGGVGKTRTALRAAARLRPAFPDGVWLVELSALEDAELLSHAVAHGLGLQDQTIRSPVDVLAEFLPGRRLLLVLDTCEHLLDACALLADVLLAASPELRILATSRRTLNVEGEAVLTVPPLPVPGPGAPLEHDLKQDAVILFAERAAAVDSRFALTPRNQTAVTRLCRRLEGIPLALELAAVWVSTLPVEEIVKRLDQRFELLSGGTGTPPRHEALRTTIGWSHELCAPMERLMWARVAVFAGAFDEDAAVAVCADDRLPSGAVPGLLAALADKSVLLREENDAGIGYRMLDTLREYGTGWLESLGERRAVQRLHRDHHLALARRFERAWCGPGQLEWYATMSRAHADLRAALEFSLSAPDERTAGLDLAGRLHLFWASGGLIREGRHYLDRLLALGPSPSPPMAKALWACARIAGAQGDLAAAEALIERCRPYAEGGDLVAAGNIAYIAGGIALFRGEHDRAAALLGEAVAIHRHGGDSGTGLLLSLAVHGMVRALRGDFDHAVALLEECRALCERRGERWARSFADYMRGLAELGRGDVAAATWYARESLRFRPLLRDSLGTALALDLLASAAVAAGDAGRAAVLLGFAEHVWHTFGLPQFGSADLAAKRERCERQTSETLGDVAYQAAFRQGKEFALVDGIDYALGSAPR
ncbi:ATP-binding protein [Actinomadura rubrisoli]|uniref:LuxR family transcriptional regulator n=1 Tax=Actinomadura rubrisoli TaxID=2530368 RepID=A0A4R5B4A8_9ACTN|nr:LuxR family transcriptional regulator [Actinomadura rubrisoli]TDD81048.1 LuxR family transcriptional regulator [Actinomadura rubrisoli]